MVVLDLHKRQSGLFRHLSGILGRQVLRGISQAMSSGSVLKSFLYKSMSR
jgi:hypothetical protein